MIFKRAVAKLRVQNWTAITIELVIVTLGVLIALAAQQWANGRAQTGQMRVSMKAVRDEMVHHYVYAVEYRVVYPCVEAQLKLLRNRVLASGATLTPAPLYRDENFHYVVMQPSKNYSADAWRAAINDGTVQRLEPSLRAELAGHYGQLPEIEQANAANNESDEALIALTHRLPLDPSVRYSIIREIEQVRARTEYLDYMNSDLVDNVRRAGRPPSVADTRAVVERFGTYKFCKAHGLPMRPFQDAMVAVPN